MPLYEFYCETCKREVTLTQTLSEHAKGGVACPQCGGTSMRPLVGPVFIQTSRKS